MLHTFQLTGIMQRKDTDNETIPVSVKFYDKHGDLITIEECVCTSASFKNKTVNVKITPSDEFRTIRTITIIELNGQEVYR